MSKNEIGVAETVDMLPQQPGEKLTVEFEITSGGKKIARAKRNDGRKKSVVQYPNGRTVTTESIPPSEE